MVARGRDHQDVPGKAVDGAAQDQGDLAVAGVRSQRQVEDVHLGAEPHDVLGDLPFAATAGFGGERTRDVQARGGCVGQDDAADEGAVPGSPMQRGASPAQPGRGLDVVPGERGMPVDRCVDDSDADPASGVRRGGGFRLVRPRRRGRYAAGHRLRPGSEHHRLGAGGPDRPDRLPVLAEFGRPAAEIGPEAVAQPREQVVEGALDPGQTREQGEPKPIVLGDPAETDLQLGQACEYGTELAAVDDEFVLLEAQVDRQGFGECVHRSRFLSTVVSTFGVAKGRFDASRGDRSGEGGG